MSNGRMLHGREGHTLQLSRRTLLVTHAPWQARQEASGGKISQTWIRASRGWGDGTGAARGRKSVSVSGVVQFWDGKPLRYLRGRFVRYRQALQQKRKLGMVQHSKGKEASWARHMNHQVSREIVDIVAAQGGVLYVEKLLGIRNRVKMTRMVQSWPFAQLLDFITYKAALAGVQVIEEDPRHTSQRCSACGHTDRKRRGRRNTVLKRGSDEPGLSW